MGTQEVKTEMENEYGYLKSRALKVASWSEIVEVQSLIARADLTEDDKFILNSYMRARVPFMGE